MNETAKPSVAISTAKGRPMLSWVGKRPLSHVPALPAQHIETFDPTGALRTDGEGWKDWPAAYPKGGLLFHGDNKEVLGHLLANGFRGKVDLVYIDPPFDSGADYVRRVSLRGPKGTAKLAGETYSLGEQIQYTDIWANDNYLQFMYERLLLLKELMTPAASIYLQCDWHRSHLLRCLLDEVFGPEAFVNEIIWRRADAHNDPGRFGMIHETLYYYALSADRCWNSPMVALSQAKLEQDAHYVLDPSTKTYFRLGDLRAPGDRGPLYAFKGITRHWKWSRKKLEAADRDGQLYFTKNGIPFYKKWIDNEAIGVQDLWFDLPQIKSGGEKTDFRTQKPESLLQRVIRTSSNPGGLVLDCFVGSGTTAAVAQRHGRRWIGCDINKGAIQTTAKRIQAVIESQTAAEVQGELPTLETEAHRPAQIAFTTWRVNDYDLQIQHNEAVELACEALGVERVRTDGFFDGTLGKALVRIIPFNHPLSPLDLEEVRRELDARPDEDRAVKIVCLGAEVGARSWVEDWNRLRKGSGAVNRIEVIELRTDERYGKLLKHEPSVARVKVSRTKKQLVVEIRDFVSPTIIERLQRQAGVVQPEIEDWRWMVDCVLIDPDYDGEVFNVALADMPEKKSDLVVGRYELPPIRPEATVAVKLIDMLGEEVLVTVPPSK